MADISRLVLEIDSKGVVTASGNLNVFNKKSKETEQTSQKSEKGIKGLIGGIKGLVTPVTVAIGSFIALTKSIVNFSKSSIDAFAEYEMIEANLSIVLGSAERASIAFDELKVMAAKTPFEVAGLANAAVQLKQTGTAMSDMIPVLTMLGDAAGGSNEKLNRIVMNYAQIQSVGKTTAIDIRQFAQMGLPIYEIFKKMGITGNATAEQVKEAFRIMTSEGGAFFNGMAIGAGTLSGKTSTLKDTWTEFQATWAENSGLAKIWGNVIDGVTKAIQKQTDTINQYHKEVELRGKIDKGLADFIDEQEYLLIQIKKNEEILEQSKNGRKYYDDFGGELNDITRKQLANDKARLEIINKTAEGLKKQRKEQELLQVAQEKQVKKFDDTYGFIQEMYSQSENYKKTELEKQIAKAKAFLVMTKPLQVKKGYGESFIKNEGITDKQRKETEIVLHLLSSQLDELNKKGINGKKTWREYFQEITNINMNDNKTGLQGALEFLDTLERTTQKERNLKTLFNEDFTTTDELINLDTQLKTLYEAKTKLLNEKGLDKNFTPNDNSIQILEQSVDKLVKKRKKLNSEIEKENRLKHEAELFSQGQQEISNLRENIQLLKMTNEERLKAIALKKTGNEAQAKEIALLQQQYDYQQSSNRIGDSIQTRKNDAIASGNVAEYGGGVVEEAIQKLIQGTDVGNFANSMAKTGNPAMAVIETFVLALTEVIQEIGGLEELLSPIKTILKELKPVIKMLLLPLMILGKLIKALGGAIMTALNTITFGFFGMISDTYDSIAGLNEEKRNEEERLKALIDQYGRLKLAMQEQEEYYYKQKRHLQAQYLNETTGERIRKVNDMIITPQGNFSTHPDDYIIASKNPQALGGSKSNVAIFVNIENHTDADVQINQKEIGNGTTELIVMISKKVAGDYATGNNGWDNAYQLKQSRLNGRRLST